MSTSKKILQVAVTILIIVLLVTASVTTVRYICAKKSAGTQIKNHIGYFDEDIPSGKVKKTQTQIDVNNRFFKSTVKKSNGKSYNSHKKLSTKLTSVQRKIKNNQDTNSGEWLPAVFD